MRNRASRAASVEEILTVIRLGLPHELRRSSPAVENALGTVRQVTRRQTLETRRDGGGPPPACWRPTSPQGLRQLEMLSRNT